MSRTTFASDAPEQVLRQVADAIEMGDYQADALDLAERTLGIHRQTMDRAQVRAAWKRAWARPRRAATQRVVEDCINFVLRRDHVGRLTVDLRFQQLPENLRHPDVKDGVMTVKDPKRTRGAIYLRSYMEVTPPELLVRSVHVAAGYRKTLGLTTCYPFPLCWDVTDGSGTARKVLGAMGGQVVCSDLTAHFGCITLDVRNIGEAERHKLPFFRRYRTGDQKAAVPSGTDDLSTNKPHMVFVDPPSRGTPSHQEVYGDGAIMEHEMGLDLAELDRETWTNVVGWVVVVALLDHISEGGVVALTVREGRREREHVSPEEGVTEDVLGVIREGVPDLEVLDDVRVVYDRVHTCQQTSLGASRLPMRHLVLAVKGETS